MKRLTALLLGILLVLPGVCLSESSKSDKKQAVLMPEVVVTAIRTEQNIEKVPANISVINASDIQRSTAKTVPDLLRHEEGVSVRDYYGNGKNMNVDLRGFGETGQYNTLVLVDGRRVNDIDLSGVDWTQIPLDQIERIEVVRGTGTVLYGDNAAGGVINIITKIPSEAFKTSAGLTLGSYQYKKGLATIEGGTKDIKAALNISAIDTDGYRNNNHYRTTDFGGKILYDLSDFLGLNFSGAYHRDDFGLPGPLTQAQIDADRKQTQDAYYDDGESTDGYLTLGADIDLLNYGSFVIDLSYRKSDSESMFRGTWPWLQKNDKKTWALTPRYVWNGDLFNRNNTLIAGVDIYSSKYRLDNFSGPGLPTSGDANSDRRTVGIYLSDEHSIMKQLIFSFGARYENVRYDLNQMDTTSGTLDETVSDEAYAYHAGLTYLYRKSSSVFARVNRSFRFPLADEMVETVGTWPALSLQINSDLKPQTGLHYEVGMRHAFNKKASAHATLYRADIKNEILLDKVTYPPFGENVNHPATLHQGIELGGKLKPLENLSFYGNYTYQSATFEKAPHKGNDIPGVPNHKGNIGFGIHEIMRGLAFFADYNYMGASYAISDMANQYNKLKAYYTVDVKLAYTYKTVRAQAGIKNLTDQKYSEYAIIGGTPTGVNYYPAPERNFFAGIEFMF